LKASVLNSGTPIAAACKKSVVPRRTFRDWVNRKRLPLKRLERNALLPADAGKQLHPRIVRVRQVGWGLTLKYISKFLVKICKETAGRSSGKVERWQRAGFLSEKETWFNSEESRKSQL
jgi:hypothetical protein